MEDWLEHRLEDVLCEGIHLRSADTYPPLHMRGDGPSGNRTPFICKTRQCKYYPGTYAVLPISDKATSLFQQWMVVD